MSPEVPIPNSADFWAIWAWWAYAAAFQTVAALVILGGGVFMWVSRNDPPPTQGSRELTKRDKWLVGVLSAGYFFLIFFSSTFKRLAGSV